MDQDTPEQSPDAESSDPGDDVRSDISWGDFRADLCCDAVRQYLILWLYCYKEGLRPGNTEYDSRRKNVKDAVVSGSHVWVFAE